ncbi:hypothetical protein AMTRI_Chr13g92120 [Amborella trichopoda]
MESPLLVGEERVVRKSVEESKRLWKIAGPIIFTSICQFSLGAVTQTFLGHVGTTELAVFSIENSVIAGFSFGVMLGMGSALETLSGQAFGAGRPRMLGVYMQRSWIILLGTSMLLTFIYIFSPPILRLFGQSNEISELTGKFALWMLPQLYAYAVYFPIQKFLQSQRKVMVMAVMAGSVLVFHVFLSWLLILKLKWSLAGGAISLNLAWWIHVLGQFSYIVAGYCPGSWTGFSWLAFRDLFGFFKLSLASGVMLCLEFWYMMILVVLVGHLSNPEIEVDAMSVCMNIVGWHMMISLGFNAAIGVRVSNELGAGNYRKAKLAVYVVSVTSIAVGIVCMAVILITRNEFPSLFTNSSAVKKEATKISGLLASTLILNSLQPVLAGVAIGAGWQALIAYINVGCYYIVGLPLGCILGYKLNLGLLGLWGGLIGGTILQTIILAILTACTDWKKEASVAENRIKKWGGSVGNEDDEHSQGTPS